MNLSEPQKESNKSVMRLSVILPCYNAATTIAMQLEALCNQTWCGPWEVIVSDTGSTDASIPIVERYRNRLPNLQIVNASAQRGQPHAVNRGVEAAAGDALLFCDADDEVAPEWLSAMGTALCSHDFVACRLDTAQLNLPWARDDHPQQRGLLGKSFCSYLHAGGCSLGVKKSLFESVGGYDESMPYHHDTDFCFKVQATGVKLYFVSDAVVHYRSRPTLVGIFNQRRHWGEYEVLLYKRWRSTEAAKLSNWIQLLGASKEILRELKHCSNKKNSAAWMRKTGRLVGYWLGSIRFRTCPPPQSQMVYSWESRVRAASRQIKKLIPAGSTYILVDESKLDPDTFSPDRRALPFLEHNGQYWGLPENNEIAISEIGRLRQLGAQFIVFPFSALWWLDFYVGFRNYLFANFPCPLKTRRVVVFDLRNGQNSVSNEFLQRKDY